MYIRLPDDAKIIFKDEVYTNAEIEKFYLSRRESDVSFMAMLAGRLPIVINSDPNSGPLILTASMKRFPYTINGEQSESYCSHGIRLIPSQGQVSSVQLKDHRNRRVATDNFEATPDRISADFGNGSLHFELSFCEIEFDEEIGPPSDFKENRHTT